MTQRRFRMAKELVLVRHSYGPADDRVFSFARQQGFAPVELYPFRGDTLDRPVEQIAGTVIYGGMYNVFEEDNHPFLRDEARWIEACMTAGVPVLGLCQGAQQIARLLGAHVGPRSDGQHEFGYFEVRPTATGREFLPEARHFVQAHFHTFDIPDGAAHLAESDAFENQAFRYGENVFGLQFHPECTIEGFRRWQDNPPDSDLPGVQAPRQQRRLMAEHDEAQAVWFYDFLKTLFGAAR